MKSRYGTALVVGLGVLAIGSAGLIPAAMATQPERPDHAPDQIEAPIPELAWEPCGLEQCATVQVPLDYDNPNGDTTTLALKKYPTTGSDGDKVGTLFVNLGGPGETATEGPMFGLGIAALGPQIRTRFDIVGIDPRGAGGSTPITCAPAPGEDPVQRPTTPIPRTEEQLEARIAWDNYVRQSCAETADPIIDNMSMADVARDMDLIRQAVGDEKLTFYGLSYGSLLGQTYSALFPDRVRAMVIDGVLDPIASTTGRNGDHQEPVGLRMGRHTATEEALTSVLAHCDRAGFPRCPLAGDARERWQRVHDSLEEEPLELGGFVLDGLTFRASLTMGAFQMDHMGGYPLPTIELLTAATKIIDVLRFGLSSPTGETTVQLAGRPDVDLTAPRPVLERQLVSLLDELNQASEGTVAPIDPTQDAEEDVAGGGARTMGALCTDSVNSSDPRAWADAATASEEDAPMFGPLTVWGFSLCAGWPGSSADAYHGDFDTALSTPPLIIGNIQDAASPMEGARAAQKLHEGSKLVTLNAWGHTAIGKSSCVTELVQPYLIDQQLPDKDQTCDPDYNLFGTPTDAP